MIEHIKISKRRNKLIPFVSIEVARQIRESSNISKTKRLRIS